MNLTRTAMHDEIYISKEKYDELTEELDYLKGTKRKEIAQALEYAKSLGDLSENAEYHEARTSQAGTEERIRRIEHILKNATIVDHKKSDSAEIGSTVVVKRGRSKEKKEFQLVGSQESNMSEGKISYSSPLGSALIGAKKGDKVKVSTPGGEVDYTIVNVK